MLCYVFLETKLVTPWKQRTTCNQHQQVLRVDGLVLFHHDGTPATAWLDGECRSSRQKPTRGGTSFFRREGANCCCACGTSCTTPTSKTRSQDLLHQEETKNERLCRVLLESVPQACLKRLCRCGLYVSTYTRVMLLLILLSGVAVVATVVSAAADAAAISSASCFFLPVDWLLLNATPSLRVDLSTRLLSCSACVRRLPLAKQGAAGKQQVFAVGWPCDSQDSQPNPRGVPDAGLENSHTGRGAGVVRLLGLRKTLLVREGGLIGSVYVVSLSYIVLSPNRRIDGYTTELDVPLLVSRCYTMGW